MAKIINLEIGERLVEDIENEIDSLLEGEKEKIFDFEKKDFDNEIKKCTDWIKNFQNLINKIMSNQKLKKRIDAISTNDDYSQSWINYNKNRKSYEKERKKINNQELMKEYEYLLKKGYILLQRFRLLSQEDAQEIQYEIGLEIEGTEKTLKEVKVDMKEMLKRVTLDFTHCEENISDGLSFIKRTSLQIKKENFNVQKSKNNEKGSIQIVRGKKTETSQRGTVLDYIQKIFNTVNAEDIDKRYKNLGRQNEIMKFIEQQGELQSFYSLIKEIKNISPRFFSKSNVKKIGEKNEVSFNFLSNKKLEKAKLQNKVVQLQQLTNTILQNYTLDNIPFFGQSGDSGEGEEYKYVEKANAFLVNNGNIILKNIILALNSFIKLRDGKEKATRYEVLATPGGTTRKEEYYILQGKIKNEKYTGDRINHAVVDNLNQALKDSGIGEFVKEFYNIK